jgi:phosphoenolpyruvate synthase/pyruvate phosphate dikinase
MQELVKTKELTEENVVTLETRVAEHGDEIGQILSEDSDESITSETKLRVLGDAVTTLRTHEYIEDTKVSKQRKSQFETTEDRVSALYANEASDFAKESPVNAVEYIADVIHDIDGNLTNEDIASTTVTEVTDYLEDAEEALSKGDVNKALQFTGEAKQVVELDKSIVDFLPDETNAENKGRDE